MNLYTLNNYSFYVWLNVIKFKRVLMQFIVCKKRKITFKGSVSFIFETMLWQKFLLNMLVILKPMPRHTNNSIRRRCAMLFYNLQVFYCKHSTENLVFWSFVVMTSEC